MATLNKVMLIGRLVNDPDPPRSFQNGGKVIRFRFAVNYTRPRKSPQTGQWENETAFVDIEAFNSTRENGRQLADLVEQNLHKGQQIYVEGRLRLNEWTDKNNQRQSKLLVVADSIEFLEPRGDGGMGEGGGRASRPAAQARRPAAFPPADEADAGGPAESQDQPEGDIPF